MQCCILLFIHPRIFFFPFPYLNLPYFFYFSFLFPFPQITVKLDLSKNDIQVLPTHAFLHIPHLTHLTLQRCNIRAVREGAFRTLGRLVSLNLANNNIEILYQVR